MPAISITVDHIVLATISTQNYDMITVRVNGGAVDDEFLVLEAAASKHPKEGESTYHLFIPAFVLRPGQQVKVAMLENGENSHRGKTITEVFPDAESRSDDDVGPINTIVEKREDRPRRREKYAFSIESSSGVRVVGDTVPQMHIFALSAVWHAWTPDSTRVSMYSRTIDGLEQNTAKKTYFEEEMQVGDTIVFVATA